MSSGPASLSLQSLKWQRKEQRQSNRIPGIDALRGVAVIMMIATHVSDAFLSPLWRQGPLWESLNLLFGYTAPAFLLLAGISVSLALERGVPIATITRRFVGILLIGYWLQIPTLSLDALLNNPSAELLHRLFDSNVLQVIGIGGLLLAALAAITQKQIAVARSIALGIGITVVVATPWILNSNLYRELPIAIAGYFAPQPEATFPLVPFVAYMMVGMWLPLTRTSVAVIAIAGGVEIIGALLLRPVALAIPPFDDIWGSSPVHYMFRLGGILLVAAIPMAYRGTWPQWTLPLLFIGRASLPIYVLHLMLVYGSPVTKGMYLWFDGPLNRTLDPVSTLGLFVAITVAISGAVYLWRRFVALRPAAARTALMAAWMVFTILFVCG